MRVPGLWYLRAALLAAALFVPLAAWAAPAVSPPTYELKVSFDLAQAKLLGKAVIRGRRGRQLDIDLGGLTVLRLSNGGRELPIPGGQEQTVKLRAAGPVEIDYEARFADSDENLISADAVQLQGQWYPTVAGMHVYHLSATLPEGFTAVSEAEAIRRTRTPAGVRFDFDFSHPLAAADGITLAASRHFVVQRSSYDKVVITAYLSPGHAQRAGFFLEEAKRYLRRFESELGPYPFKRLAIVEAPGGGGLSMPTYVLLESADFDAERIEDTALGHEIAHQWFGNLAYIDYEHGNWGEGVTVYFADHADAAARGRAWACRKRMIEGYENSVGSDGIPLTEFSSRHNRPTRSIGYGKSAMVFHMVALQIGQKAFLRSVRDFLRTERFRVAGWDDWRLAFERNSHQDLRWLFAQWLTRTDVPELRLDGIRDEPVAAGFALSFAVHQIGEPFRLTVPILIRYDGGERRVQAQIAKREQRVRVRLPGRPREIVLDPDYDVFRRPAPAEITPTIQRLLTRPEAMVVASTAEKERYAALPDILAAADTALRLHWRQVEGPRKTGTRSSGRQGTGAGRWREVFKRGQAAGKGRHDVSLILLGRNNPVIHRLFGDLRLPARGFGITVRTDPRNPAEVVAIITADARDDLRQDAALAIEDYEESSTVLVANGKLVAKQTAQSERGIRSAVP
ncbi:aminopeptidase N [mine drainage metagenome]|uniref:Aminopeptidase N n=1 Tax=mine drainage metagenome TaxID=410659 RepID=A0A1J5RTR5_9ZZZZ